LLEPNSTTTTLFESQIPTETIHSFLLNGEALWVAGEITGLLDLRTRQFRRFSLADGLGLQKAEALGCAGGRIFTAGDGFRVYSCDPANKAWKNLSLPPASYSSGTLSPLLLAGSKQFICYVAGAVLIHDVGSGAWTNVSDIGFIKCIATDETGFWFGCGNGLARYELGGKRSQQWTTPSEIHGMLSVFGFPYTGTGEILRDSLEVLDDRMASLIRRIQRERGRTHDAKLAGRSSGDPLRMDSHIPGEITAIASDGDFLWLGVANNLIVMHKPTASMGGYFPMPAPGGISAIAVSQTSVWVGIGGALFRLQKEPFLAVPESRRASIAISPEERARLIKDMNVRDKSMYAFYAGDDARVIELLGNVDPKKASLEQMLLAAFSYGALRSNHPREAQVWADCVASRYPGSPWSRAIQDTPQGSARRK